MKILKECFPTSHRLYKIFNKNTVRFCYNTTANMARKIKQHNRVVLRKKMEGDQRVKCNCKNTNVLWGIIATMKV